MPMRFKIISIAICIFIILATIAAGFLFIAPDINNKPVSRTLIASDMLDLGEKYLLDFEYEKALVQFKGVIIVEPKNPRGYTGAADAYIGLTEYEEAEKVLMQGLDELPGNTEISEKLEYVDTLIDMAKDAQTPVPAPLPSPTIAPTPATAPPVHTPTPAPAPLPTLSPKPQTLLEAIYNTDYWVRLTIDRPATGRGSTIFERDINSTTWLITGIEGNFRISDPMFSRSGDTVIMEFATTSNTYVLEGGATGAYGEGIGVSKDDIVWSIETGSDFPLGRMYDEGLTEDLRQALADNKLVAISIYFNNGDKAILYHNLDDNWNLKPRGTGLSAITPSITYSGNITVITFTYNSRDYRYELHDGGYIDANGESASWSYAYYVR